MKQHAARKSDAPQIITKREHFLRRMIHEALKVSRSFTSGRPVYHPLALNYQPSGIRVPHKPKAYCVKILDTVVEECGSSKKTAKATCNRLNRTEKNPSGLGGGKFRVSSMT